MSYLNFNTKLKDANIICKSLLPEEKKDVDCLTSKNLVFLKIHYNKNTPAGFFAIKKDPDSKYKDSYVILAVSPEYRGKGIASSLVKSGISWFKKSEFDFLFWPCRIDNEASNKLAKSSGFKFCWKKDNGKSNVYKIEKKHL